MTTDPNAYILIDGQGFANLACSDQSLWSLLENITIEHTSFGCGNIRFVSFPYISIHFEQYSGLKTFNTDAFRKGFFGTIYFPAGYSEQLSRYVMATASVPSPIPPTPKTYTEQPEPKPIDDIEESLNQKPGQLIQITSTSKFELILFDLDDTLLCSSHLEHFRGKENLGVKDQAYVESLIEEAKKLSPIFSISLLSEIRSVYSNIKIGIITRSPRVYCETLLSTCFTQILWDCIISFEDVRRTKPDPEGILKAAHDIGVNDLMRVMYVGDEKADIIAAYQAGCYSVLCECSWDMDWQRNESKSKRQDHYNALELLPDALLKCPTVILKLIQFPSEGLLALEEWDSYCDDRHEQMRFRVERRNHFNRLEMDGRSAQFVSVNVLGRYFAAHHTGARFDFTRKITRHALTRSILDAKDGAEYPDSWIGCCIEYIQRVHDKSIRARKRLIVTIIPARPGRSSRLEHLLIRLEQSYNHNSGEDIAFDPRLLRYKEGVKANKELNGEARFKNIRDHLEVVTQPIPSGQFVMVLDDVTTSGATFFYAEKYIKDAGAEKVHCVALAQTVSP